MKNLEVFVGVYHQEDGNTFLIGLDSEGLTLSLNKDEKKRLIQKNETLFEVEEMGAQIQFLSTNGITHSLELILPDRRTVAKKQIMEGGISDSPTAKGFAKEMVIGLIIIVVLGAIVVGGNGIWKSQCEKGGKMFCYLAAMSGSAKGNKKELEHISSNMKENNYQGEMEKFKEGCKDDKAESCHSLANELKKLGKDSEFVELMKDNCAKRSYFPSCKSLSQYYKFAGDAVHAVEILQQACQHGLGDSCHELAMNFKKNGQQEDYLKMLEKGCELEHALSCDDLGYQNQIKNNQVALDYFKKACHLKNKASCNQVAEVETFMESMDDCKTQNGPACRRVAEFLNRYGDKNEAITYFKTACELGSGLACTWLKKRKIQ